MIFICPQILQITRINYICEYLCYSWKNSRDVRLVRPVGRPTEKNPGIATQSSISGISSPLTFDCWPSTVDCWLLTVDCWPSTVDCWPLTVDCWLKFSAKLQHSETPLTVSDCLRQKWLFKIVYSSKNIKKATSQGVCGGGYIKNMYPYYRFSTFRFVRTRRAVRP